MYIASYLDEEGENSMYHARARFERPATISILIDMIQNYAESWLDS